MKRVLVTGSSGQIGSDLVPELRRLYGEDNVVAAFHRKPPHSMERSLPHVNLDVTDYFSVDRAVKDYGINTIFHLASVLSNLGEQNPSLAYAVNIEGTWNVLQSAKDNNVESVTIPSSIAAFGPETPRTRTPNDTIQKPRTIYGISKVLGEHLGNYYYRRFGLDVRGVRLPGIVSWKTEPTAGTTDYAVAIFYDALRHGSYECYIRPDTRLPMMYMPDALQALVKLAEADGNKLEHRADFNVNAMSFTPEELAETIRKHIPDFKVRYKIDLRRQEITDSWPESLDDSDARREWGWKPSYDIGLMTVDMLENLERKLQK